MSNVIDANTKSNDGMVRDWEWDWERYGKLAEFE